MQLGTFFVDLILDFVSLFFVTSLLQSSSIGVQSLLSCVAFGYGCESFSKYEEQGIGIQWHNIHISPEEGERYTFLLSIINPISPSNYLSTFIKHHCYLVNRVSIIP